MISPQRLHSGKITVPVHPFKKWTEEVKWELGFACFFTGKGITNKKWEWDFGKNRLGNGTWATFGLRNGISTPLPIQDTLKDDITTQGHSTEVLRKIGVT